MTWLAAFWRGFRRQTTRERIAPPGAALSIMVMMDGRPFMFIVGLWGLVIFIAAWAGEPEE